MEPQTEKNAPKASISKDNKKRTFKIFLPQRVAVVKIEERRIDLVCGRLVGGVVVGLGERVRVSSVCTWIVGGDARRGGEKEEEDEDEDEDEGGGRGREKEEEDEGGRRRRRTREGGCRWEKVRWKTGGKYDGRRKRRTDRYGCASASVTSMRRFGEKVSSFSIRSRAWDVSVLRSSWERRREIRRVAR
jgi:hypothetical protein